jgi:hypothetical protein
MHSIHRSALLVVASLALGCTRELPPAPRDLGAVFDEGEGSPPSSATTLFSKNVKLLANVPKSNEDNQSDIAFSGHYAYAGSYGGFRIIDIADPEHPAIVSVVPCSGAQGDVSVYGGLLFESVDHPQSSAACSSQDVDGYTPDMFEGIRIFDVSNPAAPAHIASVRTDCGSHTNTLLPDAANGRVLVYVSSYPSAVPSGVSPVCQFPHGYISIITVPLANPAAATVSKYYLDAATEVFSMAACHDIAVFLEIKRAAASCFTENQIWDISDLANPHFMWRFDDPAVNRAANDLWHSATFSWDGTVVAFCDESGGGAQPRCTDPTDQQGRIWFVSMATHSLLGTYKIPRSEPEQCTTHYFNFIPQPDGRKVLVGAWYTGGTSIVDIDRLIAGGTSAESEMGFYRPSGDRTWSSYW